MKQETFDVQGMHCASCSHIISKTLKKLPGISSCDVNFATEKANIQYDSSQITPESMNQHIGKLGYSLHPHDHPSSEQTHHDHAGLGMDHSEHVGLTESQEQKLKILAEERRNTYISFPIAVVVFVMMVWDLLSRFLPLPMLSFSSTVLNPLLFIAATGILFGIGKSFLSQALRFVKYRVANMDTLVGIGTFTAYVYSSIVFLFPVMRQLLALPEHVYFDVVIVVISFITLGKYLEARSKLRTGEAVQKLIGLHAKMALVIRDGKEQEIPVSEVVVGDILVVKPGQKIPVDGVIIEGTTSIDESMITGESIPVDKKVNDPVIGATINKQGSFRMKATEVGEHTALAKIISMVEKAQGSKAPIEHLADRVSEIFVPVVLLLSLLVFVLWLIVGSFFMPFSQAFSFGLLSFVGILVIACPCALGLATPTAIIVGVGRAASEGILVKDAESLEKLAKVNLIVFDKTGTITKGKPEVTDVIPMYTGSNSSSRLRHPDESQDLNEKRKNDILQLLGSLEKLSEHPLAIAVIEKLKVEKLEVQSVKDFKAIEGKGVEGSINSKHIWAGNLAFAHDKEGNIDLAIVDSLTTEGKTPVIIGEGKTILGYVGIADTVKDEAQEIIQKLHELHIQTVMISGDTQKTAQYIAQQVGIDRVLAEVLPGDKANEISKLQKEGHKVAMVGDGINDAPALATADVGIAMGTGTDVAIESAGITLLGGNLKKIATSINLSRATMRVIKQNLFWAFFYNLLSIPVAAGVLYPLFGIMLSPAIAGAAMAFSSVSVVTNSLRLKRIHI